MLGFCRILDSRNWRASRLATHFRAESEFQSLLGSKRRSDLPRTVQAPGPELQLSTPQDHIDFINILASARSQYPQQRNSVGTRRDRHSYLSLFSFFYLLSMGSMFICLFNKCLLSTYDMLCTGETGLIPAPLPPSSFMAEPKRLAEIKR